TGGGADARHEVRCVRRYGTARSAGSAGGPGRGGTSPDRRRRGREALDELARRRGSAGIRATDRLRKDMASPHQRKIKVKGPVSVTANRLSDGAVVWRTAENGWSEDIADAHVVTTPDD